MAAVREMRGCSPVSSAFMSAMDEHTDRQRLADELDRAIHEAAMVRHRLRLSPTPRRLDPDDPISRADAAVEAARSALRTLDELDESGSSRN